MKTEEELRERMKNSVREHSALMEGVKFEDLDEAEQEQATALWHEVSVLHWILEGY